MTSMLDLQKVETVFQSRPDIIEGIKTTADSPRRIALFNEIASHVYDQLRLNGEEPAQKKRKLVTEQHSNGATDVAASALNAENEAVSLEIKEISVSVPQRKKFELCFTANHLYARAPGTTAPIPGICYAWRDIEYAFYLPVPDKAQVQHNYILFPKGSYLPSKSNAPVTIEPLVFTVPVTAPKQGTIGGTEAGAAAAVLDTYKSLFHWALSRHFRSVGSSVEIVSADPNKFQSALRQPHRPNEKAVHVGGFRGSKDGFLFFLENGILWGFKKPLVFVPMTRIAAISYTNILQITFNMVMEIFLGDDYTTEEIEFGMLDQQDYGAIENYVRSNRLQDRSMAEQRKAKLQLAENRDPKKSQADESNGDAGVDNGHDDGLTDLERARLEAEQQAQNDGDEEEDDEDFDPESEGESEGSGSSSEGEDENGQGEDNDDEELDEEYDEEAEEGEGEEEEEEEEEEEVKQEPEPTPARIRSPPKVLKKETPSMPVRSGWASLNTTKDDIDMDEEKFDVVG